MKLMKKYFSVVAVAILALSFANCGSSDATDADDGTDDTTTDTTETSAEVIAETTMSLVGTTSSLSAGISEVPPSLRYAVSAGDLSESACVSGTLTYTYDDATGAISLIADQCVDEDSTTIDGTLSFDGDTMSFGDFTVESDGVTSTIDGDIVTTVGSDSITVVFDGLSGSIDDETYTIEGTLTYDNSTGFVSGDLAFTVNSVGVTCTFTDFDVDTAAEEDFADACSLD